jgi:hypothetical protein
MILMGVASAACLARLVRLAPRLDGGPPGRRRGLTAKLWDAVNSYLARAEYNPPEGFATGSGTNFVQGTRLYL